MAVRRNRSWTLIPLVACLIQTLVAPTVAFAAGSDDPLGRRVVDVLFVPRGAGLSPDLLTIDATDSVPGLVHVSLLRRGPAGWSEVLGVDHQVLGSEDQPGIPWLVTLGDGRYALVASSQTRSASIVQTFRLDPTENPRTLEFGPSTVFDGWPGYSGATDADGDGVADLVIVSQSDGDENGRCSDTTIHVLAGKGLELVETDRKVKLKNVKAVRLSGVASGEFDGRPGDDLVGSAYDTCGPDPDIPDRHHLVAIRLSDGSVLKDIPSTDVDSQTIVATLPIVVDVDGDGRDEVVLPSVSDVAIYDPTDDWKRLPLGAGAVPVFAATDASAGGKPGIVRWLAWAPTSGSELRSASLDRVAGSLVLAATTSTPLPPVSADVNTALMLRMNDVAGSQIPPVSLAADVDGDGCMDLVLLSLVADCAGTGPIRPGPAWLSTRPLGVVGTPGDSHLLVAEGLDWYPYPGGTTPPSPGASAPGWWRNGGVGAFFLAEVPLALDTAQQPAAAPMIPAFTDKVGSIRLEAPTDTRLLIRASPLQSGVASPRSTPSIESFLRSDTLEGENTQLRWLSNVAGTGSATASAPFDIVNEVPSQDGLPVDRWSISATTLDARGDVSQVSDQIVTYDQTAPTVSLDTPAVSAPWPFEATITGTSEPGATVSLSDGTSATVGPSVTVSPTGRFELRTQLAPWPQTVKVVAKDQSGNATPATASIMGGIDLRPYPWPAIAAVAIIIAVALSSLRGTRRVRDIAPVAVDPDAGGDLIIEDLDPAHSRRRD